MMDRVVVVQNYMEDFLENHSMMTNMIIATLFWLVALKVLRYLFRIFVETVWNDPIPTHLAYIPKHVPHPNPPGSAIPFEIPVVEATDEQIIQFMKFRKPNSSSQCWKRNIHQPTTATTTTAAATTTTKDDHNDHDNHNSNTSNNNNDDNKNNNQDGDDDCYYGLNVVAMEAAKYKGELYEERAIEWLEGHFGYPRKNLPFPYVGRYWNGWCSFWGESSPFVRNMVVSTCAFNIEHITNGFILPMLYIRTKQATFFTLTMYSEIGFLWVAIASILFSMIATYYHNTTNNDRNMNKNNKNKNNVIIINNNNNNNNNNHNNVNGNDTNDRSTITTHDYTVEQLHPSVWKSLLIHHVFSVTLCMYCLSLVDDRNAIIIISSSNNNNNDNSSNNHHEYDNALLRIKDTVCYLLIALLGTTSSLHFLGQVLDSSPYSQANTPNVRLLNHIICFVSHVWFRGIYWIYLSYDLFMDQNLRDHLVGYETTPYVGIFLAWMFFTAFNVEVVTFHFKATRGCYRKIKMTTMMLNEKRKQQ